MKSSSRTVLPEVRFNPRTYKLGLPDGGNPEDDTDPQVRLRRLEASYQTRLAAMQEQSAAEKQEAYAAGFREGTQQAQTETQARLKELSRHWAGLMQQLARARQDALQVSETQLIELVIRAVEKLIAARPHAPERIAQTLREAFDLLVTKDKVTIICAPADAAFIRDLLAQHRNEYEEIAKFIVREDPAISPGGCLVETDWGTVDARVEKRLAVIKQLWRDAAQTPGAESTEDDP